MGDHDRLKLLRVVWCSASNAWMSALFHDHQAERAGRAQRVRPPVLVADVGRIHGQRDQRVAGGIVDRVLSAERTEVGDVAADAAAGGGRELQIVLLTPRCGSRPLTCTPIPPVESVTSAARWLAAHLSISSAACV